jgi:uncharacterized protein (TIGR03437 family)
MGATNPSTSAGLPAPSDPLATTIVQPEVSLGGVRLPVAFSGLTPGQIGVYQINVGVPSNTPTGLDVALTISQGGQSTTLSVRVVN